MAMGLVLTLLGLSLLLGVTVKRVGLEVYVTLFVVSAAASMVFLFLYFRM